MNFFKGRISRRTYAVLLFVYALIFAAAIAAQVRIPGELFLAYICIPRLHDTGRSGWWFGAPIFLEVIVVVGALAAKAPIGIAALVSVALLLVPAIALMFVRGQTGPNRFGDVPNSPWERRLRPVAPWAAVGIVLAIAVTAWRLYAPVHDEVVQSQKMASAFFANPNNHTTVSVRGWNRLELNKIISDFKEIYKAPAADIAIWAEPNGILVLHFPSDIAPRALFFLVNYIQYPKGFDLTHRKIGVLAHVQLTAAFGFPEPGFYGRQASIYVPADDTRHDVVNVSVPSAGAYVIPFDNFIWRPTPNASAPATDAGL